MSDRDVRGVPYIRFHAVDTASERYRVWAAFRDRIVAATVDEAVPGVAVRIRAAHDAVDEHGRVVIWRLMSSNHREIATSGVGFDSIDAARAQVENVQRRADRLTARLVVDERPDRFAWTLQNRLTAAVVAGRWYPSKRERLLSLSTTRDALIRATVADGALDARPLVVRAPRPREKRPADRHVPDAPVIEAGARRPIKDIHRFNELGRGSR
ncbi:DUF1508 domain-containing protein [Leifsonia aquatica]|uniref:DUF1508 domain-containing protein n=1 Tax=Leifsonia aquatica TaxID=144185 RepID=UPI000B16F3AC|nr:DUF1508 domain-containing protein [Leifsonia aquatica]